MRISTERRQEDMHHILQPRGLAASQPRSLEDRGYVTFLFHLVTRYGNLHLWPLFGSLQKAGDEQKMCKNRRNYTTMIQRRKPEQNTILSSNQQRAAHQIPEHFYEINVKKGLVQFFFEYIFSSCFAIL